VLVALAAEDSRLELQAELAGAPSAVPREVLPGLFETALDTGAADGLPHLAFARQALPAASKVQAGSIKAWAGLIVEAVAGVLPDHQPWALHAFPFAAHASSGRMGARQWHTRTRGGALPAKPEPRSVASVGQPRCDLIVEAARELLAKRRRHLLRALRPGPKPFGEYEALVQLLLTSSDEGYLSVAQAPLPHSARHLISCFPGGMVSPPLDRQAPSRAYLKLLEAEARLGLAISARETCVDLGASPGGWTYVAAGRGARVIAVDRSELREDLMRQRLVRFECGDAFRYEPEAPVDWLICDVIAAAERSVALLLRWLARGACRKFVVTIKLADGDAQGALATLKRELPKYASSYFLLRLCHNKKEITAFGVVSSSRPAP
jgi:23S rRNA (cytidine2498-2'-O)-methyltransferase